MKFGNSLLKKILGGGKKPDARERKARKLSSDPRRTQSLGFLHIPKTGGSGISQFGRKLISQNLKFPIVFGHEWSVKDALEKFPDIRLAFIIRDPLERTVSGFNSRIRMGRPRNNSEWTVGEATAFSYFNTAAEMLEGLVSSDERTKSAACFAIRNISHLRHNYEFYFDSVEYLEKISGRIALIREIDDIGGFLKALCREIGQSPDLVDQHYRKQHVAPKATSSFVASLSPEAAAAARKHLAREYEIYHWLKTKAQSSASRES